MKHWNLGNTTVRNPDRIKAGLGILKKYFEGKSFTEKEHLEFYNQLLKEKVIESRETLRDGSKEISGRKWAACFNQLGFATAWKSKGPVQITEAGNALLDDNVLEEEIFLRQFLKYKLPSEIESGKEYINFDVNPFFVILKTLNDLQKEGFKGITKEEIGLYCITCIKNSDIYHSKEKIQEYRKGRSEIKGKVKKNEFYFKKKKELIRALYAEEIDAKQQEINKLNKGYLENEGFFLTKKANEILKNVTAGGKGSNTKKSKDFEKYIIAKIKLNQVNEVYDELLNLFMATKGKTLSDYSDTTVRYTVKTGLLSISGDTLVIKEDKKLLVERILSEGICGFTGNYLEYYYSSSTPVLPLDNVVFLQDNIKQLELRHDQMRKELKSNVGAIVGLENETNINRLKKFQNDLESQLQDLREELFYRHQSSEEMIADILEYFDKISDRSLLGGEAYRPAYFEWTTWRVFLAINSITNKISDTRNFNIDQELNPIHHAKAGMPDMVFEYEDFIIVCEVTLRTTENQWSEEEPVPRHVAKVMEKFPNKKVFGIFVAPTIDSNTTVEFFRKKRVINGRLHDVSIVPFTTSQIKSVLTKFKISKFSTHQLKGFLQSSIDLQNDVSDSLEWHHLVNKNINQWVGVN